MRTFLRLCLACLAAASVAGPASGHERRAAGPVQLVVGWASEPAYAGHPNAVQLVVRDSAGQPVADAQMNVDIQFGDQKLGPLALQPAAGQPGEYRAHLVPTRPGEYTFRFTGTIRGQQIDQSFTSGDQTFDSPRTTSDLEFPAGDPAPSELAARLERIDGRVAELRREASAARTFGFVGMAAGLAGLIVALVGVLRRPRPAS